MKRSLLILVCLSAVIFLAGFGTAPSGEKAKDFKLEDLSGKTVSLDSFKGHTVLMVFFTTWCPSCQDEVPQIEQIYEKYRSRDFEVLGVNIREEAKSVQLFAKENKLTFTVLLDKNGSVAKAYKVRNIPKIFILDRTGKILFCSQYLPMEQIEKEVIKALK